MAWRVIVGVCIGALVAAPAQAQVEVSFVGGYITSGGISGDGIVAGDGNIYNRIEPNDGGSLGLMFGYLTRTGAEFGFLWNRQLSELRISGTNTLTIGDMNVDNYHGYVAYNFGQPDSAVRPYVLLGVGATDYGDVDFNFGGPRTISGPTKFSTTWGAGVKVFPSANFGLRGGVRWTPTYISSETDGWWCDPFWGCYVVGDAKYSHQFEMSGGFVFRFGG